MFGDSHARANMDDERLIGTLRDALAPTDECLAEPSAFELATQRRAAVQRGALGAAPDASTRRRSMRRRVAIGATAILVLVGATTAAAADVLPPPLNAAAGVLGLHHEDTDLDRANQALADLRDAIARGDADAAARAAAELRVRLDALSPADRASIDADATAVLATPLLDPDAAASPTDAAPAAVATPRAPTADDDTNRHDRGGTGSGDGVVSATSSRGPSGGGDGGLSDPDGSGSRDGSSGRDGGTLATTSSQSSQSSDGGTDGGTDGGHGGGSTDGGGHDGGSGGGGPGPG